MRIHKALGIFSLATCGFAMAATGAQWRAEALDTHYVVLKGVYTDDERARFKLPPDVPSSGWKFDKAFNTAAEIALAPRIELARLLREEKINSSAPIKQRGFWQQPVAAMRFPDRAGRLKSVKAAELVYFIYLKLANPLQDGNEYSFTLADGNSVRFRYSVKTPSPLFKVNQAGYSNLASSKFAYLGGWLGTLGAWSAPNGAKFRLIESKSGKVALNGTAQCRIDDRECNGTPFTGEKTLELDISAANNGCYYLEVDGVGRSEEFSIGTDGMAQAFHLHALGLYHQRCGIAKTLTPWKDAACHLNVKRSVFPPEEWEYGSHFTDAERKPVKIKHFSLINAMMRDAKEELSLPGGWHDAADYDRRPMHLRIVSDLAAVYLMRPQNFSDSQLTVPERGNGIPDILDEAMWGLKHLIAAQTADGGVGTWIETVRHPNEADWMPPSGDKLEYAISRATRHSSMDYAGVAALLSRALLKAGAKKESERFAASAARAWKAAQQLPPAEKVAMRHGWKQEDEKTVYYSEGSVEAHLTVKATINLYALTQDEQYLRVLQDQNLAAQFKREIEKNGWQFSPLRFAELRFTPLPPNIDATYTKVWERKICRDGDEVLKWVNESYPYHFPWHPADSGWVKTMSWGNAHPLRQALKLIAAHGWTGERKYLDAAYLANDYHCGANPNGSTWTTGLGRIYPVTYLSLTSQTDGVAEYVPGITPYRLTYGISNDIAKSIWPNGEVKKYPILRRWVNLEANTVAASEFTVWETIGPAMAATGYLLSPWEKQAKVKTPIPAKSISDLPGYWAIP